jgi:hypothetical protein
MFLHENLVSFTPSSICIEGNFESSILVFTEDNKDPHDFVSRTIFSLNKCTTNYEKLSILHTASKVNIEMKIHLDTY